MLKNLFLIFLLFIVSSCGGGGGDSSPTNNINNILSNATTESGTSAPISGESCSLYQTNIHRCNLIHDGINRYYFSYVPPNLDTTKSIPLLFALHGYGSYASRHLDYTNYMPLADENNFIVIYPQGATTSTLSTHWNIGGWTSKSTINDLNFIETIINLVKDKIQIDETRIYSSGMSNGGYMSYHLACNLSDKFAAVASVTGSMSFDTFNDCNPSHPTAVLQIHGLLDFVVPYNGNSGSKSIPDVVDYWVNYNSCNLEPNRVINDNFIVFDTYENCLNNLNVKLIVHPEMGHDWPSIYSYGVSASIEIWNFLSKYNIHGRIN